MCEADRLQKQWDKGFAASILRDIGLPENEIKIVEGILEKENIPLKALLRQALREWQYKFTDAEPPETKGCMGD